MALAAASAGVDLNEMSRADVTESRVTDCVLLVVLRTASGSACCGRLGSGSRSTRLAKEENMCAAFVYGIAATKVIASRP